MKRRSLLVILPAAILAATTGLAVADSFGPGPFDPASGSFATYKTPPLGSTDVFTVPISWHSTGNSNWAGVHINPKFDPGEVGFLGFAPAPGFFATFPAAAAVPGFTIWSDNADQSGMNYSPSNVVPLGTLTLHATGTTPANNTDFNDVTFGSSGNFSVFNIYHVPQGSNSISVDIPVSRMVYVPPGAGTSNFGDPVPPGGGTWLHVNQMHMVHLTQSLFFGTRTFITGQGGVGVEHIPEPSLVAAWMAGLVAIVFARCRRKK